MYALSGSDVHETMGVPSISRETISVRSGDLRESKHGIVFKHKYKSY